MRQVGYVVVVKGEVAEVAVGEHLECHRCGACLATIGKKRKEVRVANGIGAGVGDKVEVETAPGFIVAAAFLIYIAPIIAGIIGGLAGYHLLPAAGLGQTPGAVIMAAVFVAGSVLLLKYIDKVYFSKQLPNIVSVLRPGDSKEGGP
jgi:sigma-E factor negative regulatory protein RseC